MEEITMTNKCFSIHTKEKEYKIYCGKKLREYQNKLSWLARKWDIPRGTTNYSGSAKKCLLETFKIFNTYLYSIYKNDLESVFKALAGKKLVLTKKGEKVGALTFPISNAGIIKTCIDLWCENLGYTISNSEKISRQNSEIKKLLDEFDKELGFKEIPMKRHYEKIREWINKNGYLFKKYIDPNMDYLIIENLKKSKLFSSV